MEAFAGTALPLPIFAAIVYSLGKAALAPIHAKLDRLIALQERANESRDV